MPERRASQHQEGPVEAPPVEGHEAVETRDRPPELGEERGLGVADESEQSVGRRLLAPAVVLLVPDAASAAYPD